jgi:hypothetical protein
MKDMLKKKQTKTNLDKSVKVRPGSSIIEENLSDDDQLPSGRQGNIKALSPDQLADIAQIKTDQKMNLIYKKFQSQVRYLMKTNFSLTEVEAL